MFSGRRVRVMRRPVVSTGEEFASADFFIVGSLFARELRPHVP
jgi:hypothetical protein